VLALLSSCASLPGEGAIEEFLSRNTEAGSAPVLYIHGAGDGPARWADSLAGTRGGFALDWEKLARDRMAAPAKGYGLGLRLARILGPGERTIYAHSAGAWLAQGLADGLAAMGRTDKPTLVFLDPFTAESLFQPWEGRRRLGLNAAGAETWYTLRDPVPFTGGEVAAGPSHDIGPLLDPAITGSPAHWAVIDWYFEKGPGAPKRP
ncbi:MAG: hypothetical protein ACOYM2_21070, partial [Rectinemataceae bacterium]